MCPNYTGCPISSQTWVEFTWIWDVPQLGLGSSYLQLGPTSHGNSQKQSPPNPGLQGDGTPCRHSDPIHPTTSIHFSVPSAIVVDAVLVAVALLARPRLPRRLRLESYQSDQCGNTVTLLTSHLYCQRLGRRFCVRQNFLQR